MFFGKGKTVVFIYGRKSPISVVKLFRFAKKIIGLGKGNRSLGEKRVYVSKYKKMTVPKELAAHGAV
jgi:hypothetical protein